MQTMSLQPLTLQHRLQTPLALILTIAILLSLLSGVSTASEPLQTSTHSHSPGTQRYSDSWVVEVEGGREEANVLAARHGFINIGQVKSH